MGQKTVSFYGELKDETVLAWLIFDGINEIWIPKSKAKLRKIKNYDYEIKVPEWLAKKKGNHWMTVPVEITAIEATTERGIWARVKPTGKLAWFPKSQTQLSPGMAYIPQWLADKICPEGVS